MTTIAVLSLAPLVLNPDGWGAARPVPGTGAQSGALSVSCGAPGQCSAGGYLTSKSGAITAVIANQVGGRWHAAKPVAGTVALNKGGYAQVLSVSCTSPGNCSAGGFFSSASFGGLFDKATMAFGVTETNGVWGSAQVISGLPAPGTDVDEGNAITSVSCASPGNCSAGGYSPAGSFAVSEAGGTWGSAVQLHGPANFNSGGPREGVTSISCASAGNCTAGGSYTGREGSEHAFVVSQVAGTWGTARQDPVTGTFSGFAAIRSVSCASAGNCTVGGIYAQGSSGVQAFVLSQTHGTWGAIQVIPGAAKLIKGGIGQVSEVSCLTPGNCTIGGYAFKSVEVGSSTQDFATPFVVSLHHGTLGPISKIPGIGALSKFGYSDVTALSCASPGNCALGGGYTTGSYNPDGAGANQAYAVDEVKGTWQQARSLTARLHSGGAQLAAIACPTATTCTAVGSYGDVSEISQQTLAFLADRTP